MPDCNRNSNRLWRLIAKDLVSEENPQRVLQLVGELLPALLEQLLTDRSHDESQPLKSPDPINRWIN